MIHYLQYYFILHASVTYYYLCYITMTMNAYVDAELYDTEMPPEWTLVYAPTSFGPGGNSATTMLSTSSAVKALSCFARMRRI